MLEPLTGIDKIFYPCDMDKNCWLSLPYNGNTNEIISSTFKRTCSFPAGILYKMNELI